MAPPIKVPETDITLYTSGTPNGQKLSITLEELGIKYSVKNIEISKNVQKEDWYLKINPNGRIPALVDRTPKADGKGQEKRIFEGGAMQLYLIQKYDLNGKISYPFNTDKYWEVVEWLVWQQSGIGPMQGQANHFFRYAPEKIQYGIDRYQNETKRLYQVLEDRLEYQDINNRTAANTKASNAGGVELINQNTGEAGTQGPWLVGDKMTIADIACFAWVNWAEWAGIDVGNFPRTKDWADRINQRPAVKRGLDVPEPFEMKKKMQTKEGEEEYQKMHSEWVMRGQKEQEEKNK